MKRHRRRTIQQLIDELPKEIDPDQPWEWPYKVHFTGRLGLPDNASPRQVIDFAIENKWGIQRKGYERVSPAALAYASAVLNAAGLDPKTKRSYTPEERFREHTKDILRSHLRFLSSSPMRLDESLRTWNGVPLVTAWYDMTQQERDQITIRWLTTQTCPDLRKRGALGFGSKSLRETLIWIAEQDEKLACGCFQTSLCYPPPSRVTLNTEEVSALAAWAEASITGFGPAFDKAFEVAKRIAKVVDERKARS